MTRAFFVLMGGVKGVQGDKGCCILSPYHSQDHSQDHNTKPTDDKIKADAFVDFLPRCSSDTKLKDEEIRDKGKADVIVKSLALIQASWFVGVTIHRIQSKMLYATEAEIVTMTFSFLNFFTYLFWWSKPQSVDFPIPFPIPSQQEHEPQGADKMQKRPPHCFTLAISILESSNTTMYDNTIPESDVYAYVGELSLEGMSIAVLSASFSGSLCGVCHLIVASLNHGLIRTVRGPIWFSLAFLGSALSFYLLVVILISFGLRASRCSKETVQSFLCCDLQKYVQRVFLIVSVIGRIALIVAILYFMFTPYDFHAFLEPNWSRYFPHPF